MCPHQLPPVPDRDDQPARGERISCAGQRLVESPYDGWRASLYRFRLRCRRHALFGAVAGDEHPCQSEQNENLRKLHKVQPLNGLGTLFLRH